jgi:hypothetical protein
MGNMTEALVLDDAAFYPYYEEYYGFTIVNEINRDK